MELEEAIVQTVLKHYPAAQAVYLFGGFGTRDERPDSDVDLAVLLPPDQARTAGPLAMSELRFKLESLLSKTVDLINLREVPTVLQKEIVMAERRLYTGDDYAAAEFEMLTLSYYLKLNEERAEILTAAAAGGRFHKI